MSYRFGDLSNKEIWRLLVDAAKQAMESAGYELNRVPGRGLSNLWLFEKNGKRGSASIRTTRDRWFAFPPLDGGSHWKTLDDVDVVLVAAVDQPDNPTNIEVYIFDADVVRARFQAAYEARVQAGHRVKDNFGMWLKLDRDDRGLPTSVGSGLADYRPPVAAFPISDFLGTRDGLIDSDASDSPSLAAEPARMPSADTISHVMAATRERVAAIAGVRLEAVKLDVKIEY
jgi:hypothetical protein